jgi:hypothetical protein
MCVCYKLEAHIYLETVSKGREFISYGSDFRQRLSKLIKNLCGQTSDCLKTSTSLLLLSQTTVATSNVSNSNH